MWRAGRDFFDYRNSLLRFHNEIRIPILDAGSNVPRRQIRVSFGNTDNPTGRPISSRLRRPAAWLRLPMNTRGMFLAIKVL
jgi:hypothetical protein